MSHLDSASAEGAGCLRTLALFALVASPVYLLLRLVSRTARQMYGFEPPPDEPTLRICQHCHNTVLEQDWTHCPYCGHPLPDAGGNAPGQDAGDPPNGAPVDSPAAANAPSAIIATRD